MKPDIVYIYGGYSEWRGQEIKYSLRSLQQFGKNFNNVYLIGNKSHYVNDMVKYYNVEDSPFYNKERRIMEKLLFACDIDELSNPFIMFNDDYFLTKPIDFSNLPYYYQYDIKTKIEKRKTDDMYRRAMVNTKEALEKKKLPILHFDIHYPIAYHKEKFKEVMKQYNWEIGCGYIIKSLYCNTLQIKGEEREDKKIYISHNKKEIREFIEKTDLFSTAQITRTMAEIFNELYPNPSIFEKVF